METLKGLPLGFAEALQKDILDPKDITEKVRIFFAVFEKRVDEWPGSVDERLLKLADLLKAAKFFKSINLFPEAMWRAVYEIHRSVKFLNVRYGEREFGKRLEQDCLLFH